MVLKAQKQKVYQIYKNRIKGNKIMDQKENLLSSPTIYSQENIGLLKSLPVLEDGQIYIYVILNTSGKIKIGKTTNIQQRLQSLSGSNGGGSKISSVYCSPSTWLKSIEGTCHNYYHFARIQGTEWFNGEKIDFNEVVEYVDTLFYTDSYKRCNELRRKFVEKIL